jgi:hypothetical protein
MRTDVSIPRSAWLLLFACCFAALLNRLVLDYFQDDAYITFRYSSNLADHGSLYYNPPAAGPHGFSNPVYVFLLAGLRLVALKHISFELLARLIASCSIVLLLFLLLGDIVRRLSTIRGILTIGSISSFLFLAFPFMLPNMFSGLETALLTLCLFALLDSLFVSPIAEPMFLVCLATALALRVDSGVTLLPLVCVYIYRQRARPGFPRATLRRLLVPLLLVLALFLVQYSLTGTLLPLSFTHKSQAFSRETFQDYLRFFFMPLLPLGVLIFRRGSHAFLLFALSFSVYISLLYSFFMHWHIERYVFPFAFSLFLVALRVLYNACSPPDWRGLSMLSVYAVVVFLAASAQGFSWVSGYRVAMRTATQIASALADAHLDERYHTFACYDAGYIAYKTGWRLVDLAGLTTPEVLHEDVGRVIEEVRPTVLIVSSGKYYEDPRSVTLRSQYQDSASAIPEGYRFIKYLRLSNRYWWPDVEYSYYIFVNEHAAADLVTRLQAVAVDVDNEMGFQRAIFLFLERLSRRLCATWIPACWRGSTGAAS